jgi:hypothetical protein
MNQRINPELEQALATAAKLSDAQQMALASEIISRVSELTDTGLTDGQRVEVQWRLSQPAQYADPAAVQAFFARHGVAM